MAYRSKSKGKPRTKGRNTMRAGKSKGKKIYHVGGYQA